MDNLRLLNLPADNEGPPKMGAIIFPYIVVIERLTNLCFRDWKVFCSVNHFIMESVVYFMSFYTKSLYALGPWKQIVWEFKFALEIYYIDISRTLYLIWGKSRRHWDLKSYSEYFKVLWTICSVIYFSNEAKGKIERVLVSSSFVWKKKHQYMYIPVFKAQYIFLFKKKNIS